MTGLVTGLALKLQSIFHELGAGRLQFVKIQQNAYFTSQVALVVQNPLPNAGDAGDKGSIPGGVGEIP